MNTYNPQEIEKKWQNRWEEEGVHKTPDSIDSKENYYLLVEYPYPSGNLHIGHWYAFAVPDILARAKRMQGYNVLFPMGFDSFGLPAENAAIKHGLDPREWTYKNIEHMTGQLKSMGNSFDWSRKVVASDPDYYKWTQWLFLQLFDAGLAYRKKAEVNWCPKDMTVLANEQVVDGACERCDAPVEKRSLEQWFIRITDYAEKLLEGLDQLEWPEEIKDSQRNWIGKSEGAELRFPVPNSGIKRAVLLHGKGGSPDTNFFPWLKQQLEAQGIEVEVPMLPNAAEPILEEQVAYVQQHCSINEETLVLGHSFGGLVALHLLSQGAKAARLVLVATPASDQFLDGNPRPTVSAALGTPLDINAVKSRARSFAVLSDSHDEVVPRSDAVVWADRLNVMVHEVRAQETHFCALQEPAVFQAAIPSVEVFTTRPDTLFGATYMVLAPEHPLVATITTQEQQAAVDAYVQESSRKKDIERMDTSKEKTGVFTGSYVVNPATGKEIPVWIADYVLASYGTGAVMAVPAHDLRDRDFWHDVMGAPLDLWQVVIHPVKNFSYYEGEDPEVGRSQKINAMHRGEICYELKGTMVNSGDFDGMENVAAKKAITEHVGGRLTNNYKLRDWLISRQRYWGTPIPVVYDPEGRPHAVPDEHLPWELPTDVDFTPTGKAPLATSKELFERTEKLFGKGWTPEVDTMDTFIDSSWYFLRYLDAHNEKEFAAREKQEQWMPVNRYSGGAEHTTMHLLYSRFFHRALYDLDLTTCPEPYTLRMNRGLILGPDGQKMSKSRGNVIDPDENVEKFGADTVKMYLAFIGPYNEPGTYPWDMGGIQGIHRFLERVWKQYTEVLPRRTDFEQNSTNTEKDVVINQTIQKVTRDIDQLKFNTSIAQLMICFNELTDFNEESGQSSASLTNDYWLPFLRMLHPFAPHMTEEIWREILKNESFLIEEEWPNPNIGSGLIEDLIVTIGVQINGKMRGTIEVAPDADETTATGAAREVIAIQKYLEEGEVIKTIYKPGKILNFIVK